MPEHANIKAETKNTSSLAEVNPLHAQQENVQTNCGHYLSIQCKLSVGAVDDPLEDEADAMADKVMRMPEQNLIQRKCAHCEEEEKAQRKPLASFIQKKCAACEEEEKAKKGGSSKNQKQKSKTK